MAKKSAVEKNNRRRRMVDRFAAKRKALKAVVMDRGRDPEERFEATLKLAEMPRNGAKVRIRNRCSHDRAAARPTIGNSVSRASRCGISPPKARSRAW